MDNFDGRLSALSTIFSNALKNFDEETTPIMMKILKQIYLTEEYSKVQINNKLAC